jgi:hypothetical protein
MRAADVGWLLFLVTVVTMTLAVIVLAVPLACYVAR